MKNFFYKIIGNKEQFTVQHRIFNATILVGILINIPTSVIAWLMDFPLIHILIPVISFFVFSAVYLYSLLKKDLHISSIIGFSYLLFVFFPFFWFHNSGTTGGFQSFAFFFLMTVIIAASGKKVHIFSVFFSLVLISIITVEYYYPELIINFPSKEDRYIDIAITYTIVFISIYVILLTFKRLYRETNNKLSEANKILTDKNIEIQKHKTEIEVQKEELKATNDNLLELMDFKQTVTGTIVHDFKNSLNSIINLSDKEEVVQSAYSLQNLVMNILEVQKYREKS